MLHRRSHQPRATARIGIRRASVAVKAVLVGRHLDDRRVVDRTASDLNHADILDPWRGHAASRLFDSRVLCCLRRGGPENARHGSTASRECPFE